MAEIIGWSGRLWSSHSPLALNPYLMQCVPLLSLSFYALWASWMMTNGCVLWVLCRITTTIIAPTPLVAANFVILGKIIAMLGTQYSRLGPTLCTFSLPRFLPSVSFPAQYLPPTSWPFASPFPTSCAVYSRSLCPNFTFKSLHTHAPLNSI